MWQTGGLISSTLQTLRDSSPDADVKWSKAFQERFNPVDQVKCMKMLRRVKYIWQATHFCLDSMTRQRFL